VGRVTPVSTGPTRENTTPRRRIVPRRPIAGVRGLPAALAAPLLFTLIREFHLRGRDSGSLPLFSWKSTLNLDDGAHHHAASRTQLNPWRVHRADERWRRAESLSLPVRPPATEDAVLTVVPALGALYADHHRGATAREPPPRRACSFSVTDSRREIITRILNANTARSWPSLRRFRRHRTLTRWWISPLKTTTHDPGDANPAMAC